MQLSKGMSASVLKSIQFQEMYLELFSHQDVKTILGTLIKVKILRLK